MNIFGKKMIKFSTSTFSRIVEPFFAMKNWTILLSADVTWSRRILAQRFGLEKKGKFFERVMIKLQVKNSE